MPADSFFRDRLVPLTCMVLVSMATMPGSLLLSLAALMGRKYRSVVAAPTPVGTPVVIASLIWAPVARLWNRTYPLPTIITLSSNTPATYWSPSWLAIGVFQAGRPSCRSTHSTVSESNAVYTTLTRR